jgi:hypothetical protein
MLQPGYEVHPSEDDSCKVIWFSNGHIDNEKRIQHLECAFLIQEANSMRIETFTEDLKIFFNDELHWLLESQGFKVEKILGNFTLDNAFTSGSAYIIPISRC